MAGKKRNVFKKKKKRKKKLCSLNEIVLFVLSIEQIAFLACE